MFGSLIENFYLCSVNQLIEKENGNNLQKDCKSS